MERVAKNTLFSSDARTKGLDSVTVSIVLQHTFNVRFPTHLVDRQENLNKIE